jgi:hypothetical protein
MKTEEVVVSAVVKGGLQAVSTTHLVACAFCRKRLADEYFLTCLKCDRSYCYIHMSRHPTIVCARQVAARTD